MTCAYAVRGALKKIPAVDSVDVSLNKGLATVKLKPGNAVKPEQFWKAVHDNGFTPKDTRVVVRGEILGSRLQVTESKQIFEIIADAKILVQLKGKTVTLEGVLKPGTDVLHVQNIRTN
jgi:copper chaperone CopZ